MRKAIDVHLAVAVTDPRAALEALIDKGLVPFKEARADLLPPDQVEPDAAVQTPDAGSSAL